MIVRTGEAAACGTGPFVRVHDPNPMMEMLAGNQLRGGFIALFITLVNAALGFVVVRAVSLP